MGDNVVTFLLKLALSSTIIAAIINYLYWLVLNETLPYIEGKRANGHWAVVWLVVSVVLMYVIANR